MAIKTSSIITKSELTKIINRPSKSIDLYEGGSPDLIDLVRKIKSSDKVSVIVIKR